MALRLILLTLLAFTIVGIPIGEAQLGGLGGLGGLVGGLISGLLNTIHVQGIVFCTRDGNIGINGPATPVFSNALVQLQCGNGNVLSSSTTNEAGVFAFVLNPVEGLLTSLLSNCSVVVKTPLSTCNANLPSIGGLQSPLKFVGNTILGLLNILNVISSGFQFNAGLNN